MRRLRKPRCPYCGNKLNFAKTWELRRRGEYLCPKCGGLSNVRMDPIVYGLGFTAFLVSAMFFAAGLFLGFGTAIWTLPGTLIPYLLFYLICALFVRLKKPAPPRVPPPADRRPGASLRDVPPRR